MGTYRPATVRFGENDMMGLFDVMAFSPSHPRLLAVQVKSNSATGIRGWKGHTKLFRELGMKTLYAVPIDNEGWVIYDCGQEPDDGRRAARVVVDEREMDHISSHRGTEGSLGDGVVQWLKSLTTDTSQ